VELTSSEKYQRVSSVDNNSVIVEETLSKEESAVKADNVGKLDCDLD